VNHEAKRDGIPDNQGEVIAGSGCVSDKFVNSKKKGGRGPDNPVGPSRYHVGVFSPLLIERY